MKSEKTLRKAVIFGTICLLLTGCFYRHHSNQEVLNGIYETDFFNESWTQLYCAYERGYSAINYFAFDVDGNEPDEISFSDNRDEVFESYYFDNLSQLENKKAVDMEYRFALDEPYLWIWLYGSREIYNYADILDEAHVDRYFFGSVFIVYLKDIARVYTLEVDYH
ncbi:MAG: hypothetical protein K6B51_06175 [Bacilli bacterium]|nr:hypothetical protein [Bacilli bacterium]